MPTMSNAGAEVTMAEPTNPSLTLVDLPDEILQSIFLYLDAWTLVNLNLTTRRLSLLSNEPLLWKQVCQNDFRYWSDRHDLQHKLHDGSFKDWKATYVQRQQITHVTRLSLDEVIKDSQARSDRIQAIVERGYEAKGALLQAFRQSRGSPNHLAQRYWSHVAMGCLHRAIALEQWTKIKYRTDVENATERSLAAFDMFVLDQHDQGDVYDVFDRLDSYVQAVRTAYPDLDEQTPRTKAMTIAACLRDRHWVGIDQGRKFHSLDNLFLGVALHSSHRNSIPLISSVIYSYVARQFNLRAQPISYPMHVHVLVRPPPGVDVDGNPLPADFDTTSTSPSSRTHLYMDPFNSIEPVPLSALQTRLRFIDASIVPSQANMYLNAATPRDLTIRCAANILETRTINIGRPVHPLSTESALYAGFFAQVLFPTHPVSLRTHLTELTQHFLHHYDHDIHIFRKYVVPLTTNLPDHLAYRNLSLQLLRNDLEPPTPKYRSLNPAENPVMFRVGQLFRHRRRNYRALIYGWDSTCEMTQQWISMNQVDRLPRGRNQPFYNVLVIDDRSTRYVAEENVVLLGPAEAGGNGEMATLEEVESWPIEVGKWMKRFEVDENGLGYKFVSNVRDQYPED